MLENIVPTNEATPDKYSSARHFWGDDSHAWLFTEGSPAAEIVPEADQKLGSSFSLIGEGYLAFDKFVETLKGDPVIKAKIGNRTLEKSTETLLRSFRARTDATDEELKEAIQSEINKLEGSIQQWTSFSPVDFLILDKMSELPIGKVVLRPVSGVHQRILSEFSDRIDKVEKFNEQQKQQTKEQISTYILQAFENVATCAEVTVEAESNKVQQHADAEVDASLNLLRCYTHLLFARDLRVKMGLRGETGYFLRPVIGFGESDSSWTFSFQSIGLLQPFVVSPESLEVLKRDYAFDTLSDILAKAESSRSQLENAVITAIRWLGRGVTAFDLPEKVLHFAAASERLLTGDKENKSEIMDKFARRLAFLVRDDPADRLQLSSRARELYKIRNNVIHAGRTDISEQDVIEMEVLTLQALIGMAKHLGEWAKHDDFISWVDKQTYGVAAANG
jgi:hypothetical protein